MKRTVVFLKIFLKKTKENELMVMSNALTYKLLIAIFPFIIFLMTLMGFLKIGLDTYINEINHVLPIPVQEILDTFLKEVIHTRRISLLSTSFIISIYSASTGFNSIIDGLNRVYGQQRKGVFIRRKLVSILLVFIFAFIITISLILFIFRDHIINILIKYPLLNFIIYFFDNLFLYLFIALILFSIVLIIYKISIYKKVTTISILPGALFTVIFWLILSKVFNIYINNFSKYSIIYGSIGGIFVLVIWLNMISLVLLLGGQFNVILQNKDYKNV